MKIAKTLTGILENEIVATALDRKANIKGVIEKTFDAWSVDLERRHPAPVYVEGVDGAKIYRGTDFDLFTFMNALAQRKAVINIPDYTRLRKAKQRADQRIISKENRHGELKAVVSNRRTHAFSARIKDYNVVQEMKNGEVVGAPRSYALVDDAGRFYRGWRTIEFKPDAYENAFLKQNKLWYDKKTLVFENFVHPALAKAFYGSRYISTKALHERVRDEAKHYKDVAVDLYEQDVRLGNGRKKKIRFLPCEDEAEKVKVSALEAKLLLPDFKGNYPVLGKTEIGNIVRYGAVTPGRYKDKQNVLRYSFDRAKELTYHIGPRLQACTRAVELAYFLHARNGKYEIRPSWRIPEFKRNYLESDRSRILWNALPIAKDVNLLYRIRSAAAEQRA